MRSDVTILKAGFETAPGFRKQHPFQADSEDDRMEYVAWQPLMSRAIVRNGFLVAPYLNTFLFFPGIVVGGRGEEFYGAVSLEIQLLDQGDPGFHHPRAGLQAGYRIKPWLLATYDLFHLTYMDLYSTAYGWSSWHDEEHLGSRLSLAVGKGFFASPALVYVHGRRKLGWGLAGIASF